MPAKKASAPKIEITHDIMGGSVVQTGNTLRIRFGGKWIKGVSFPATVAGEKLATEKRHEIARERRQMLTKSSSERLHQRRLERLTVQEAFQQFYRDRIERKCSDNTLRSYALSWRQIIQGQDYPIRREYSYNALLGRPVYKLERDAELFVRDAVERELTAQTINTHINGFSTILSYFSKCKWLPELDVNHLRVFDPGRRPVGLRDDEAVKVIQHWRTRDPDFGNLLRVLRFMGRRYKECCLLLKSRFDFEEGVIGMPNKRNPEKIELFPITDELADVYAEQHERYPESDRLFPFYNDSYSRHAKKFKKSLIELGIDLDQRIFEAGYAGGCFHVFRRTFATGMFRAGATLGDIHEAMGHSDIRTTLRYYKESRAREIKSVVEKSYGKKKIPKKKGG